MSFSGQAVLDAVGAAGALEYVVVEVVGGVLSVSGQLLPRCGPLQGLTEQQPDHPSPQTCHCVPTEHCCQRFSKGVAAAMLAIAAVTKKAIDERIIDELFIILRK